jgi:hypothetical protein
LTWRFGPHDDTHPSPEDALSNFHLAGVNIAIVMMMPPAANAADGNKD